MAEGSHPFPFRTRKLSPPAPMVLGSRGPGRVGRRRALTWRRTPGDGGPSPFSAPVPTTDRLDPSCRPPPRPTHAVVVPPGRAAPPALAGAPGHPAPVGAHPVALPRVPPATPVAAAAPRLAGVLRGGRASPARSRRRAGAGVPAGGAQVPGRAARNGRAHRGSAAPRRGPRMIAVARKRGGEASLAVAPAGCATKAAAVAPRPRSGRPPGAMTGSPRSGSTRALCAVRPRAPSGADVRRAGRSHPATRARSRRTPRCDVRSSPVGWSGSSSG